MNPFWKDIFITIKKEKKRLVALAIIAALGVTMMTGLKASCDDLRFSADLFYNNQNLHDLSILSTLGLTQDDVDAIRQVDGVAAAEGFYSETIQTETESGSLSLVLKTFTHGGIDVPFVEEGRLPESAEEIVVNQKYLNDSGKKIGDSLKWLEVEKCFRIVGTIIDVTSLINPDGTTSFRSTGTDHYIAFVLPEAVDADYFTAVNIVAEGKEGLTAFDPAYELLIADLKNRIENSVKVSRQDARYHEIYDDALSQIDDAESEMWDAFADAEEELQDGKEELEDGRGTLEDGIRELEESEAEALQQIADARQQIADGWSELNQGLLQLDDAQAQLNEGKTALINGQNELNNGYTLLIQGEEELAAGKRELETQEANAFAALDEGQKQIDDGLSQIDDGLVQMDDGLSQLDDGLTQLNQMLNPMLTARTLLQERIQSIKDQLSEVDEKIAIWESSGMAQLPAGDSRGESGSRLFAGRMVCAQDFLLSELIMPESGAKDKVSESGNESKDSEIMEKKPKTETSTQNISDTETSSKMETPTISDTEISSETETPIPSDPGTQTTPDTEMSTPPETETSSETEPQTPTETEPQAPPDTETQTPSDTEIDDPTTAPVPPVDLPEESLTQLQTMRRSLNSQLQILLSLDTLMGRIVDPLVTQRDELEQTREDLLAQRDEVLAQKDYLLEQQEILEEQRQLAEEQFAQAWATIDENEAALEDAKAELAAGQEEIDKGWEELASNQALIDEKRQEAESGKNDLIAGENQLNEEEASALEQIADAWRELEEGKEELEQGEREYDVGLAQYLRGRDQAIHEIGKVKDQLNDIPACDWYVRDRSALEGSAALVSDADCIESIGTIFPFMFLLVAILISLTTITRMVDENRGLIGTYQALGFRDGEILTKFVLYSFVASFLGGILGNLAGYIVLPEIIAIIFHTMYVIPKMYLSYNALYGIGGIILFVAAIVGTTVYCCRNTVLQMPATLMRPKAPQSGSRIFLEYIPGLWKRMSFLNKVTARNLFRYKKRLLMTIFGIAGCTGLLLCGFSIKDTVADLLPRQYENIISYDIMTVTAGGKDQKDVMAYLSDQDAEISTMQELEVTSVDIHNKEGKTLSVQLYVVPDGTDLSDFFTLRDAEEKQPVEIREDGFYISQNIKTVLDYQEGDLMMVQDMKLAEAEAPIRCILEYYLGNSIFVTRSCFEEIFEPYEANAVLLCMSEGSSESVMKENLRKMDQVLSVTSVEELKEGFGGAFALMNMVVYVVIVLAGALAFVVLFTLSTTNISERDRELATIKVLGFHDSEVHRYVNKETLILTCIGILAGLPLGVILGNFIGMVLVMPAIVYATSIRTISYFLAAGMALTFALLVEFMTNPILDRIDPIEALKSVE